MTGKKQSKSSSNSRYPASDVSYASVEISASMKDACLKWMNDASEDFETLLTEKLDESYRISLKYDYYNRCYSCSFTQQDEKHMNYSIVLISRSDNPMEALMLCLYKLMVLFPNDPLPTEHEGFRWG